MNAPSLTGFLKMTGAQYRLFDLGTQLKKLPEQVLQTLDEGQPYPHPHLGFAWFVIFIWNPDLNEQNSLWFLKLPLDEQGILSAGVHSDLVNRLYRATQETDEKERQRLLTDHPYQFKPDHEKMAALHAKATQLLGLPASQYHQAADSFYLAENTDVLWQQLGVQGIADVVCRAKDEALTQLAQRLTTLDDAPFLALAGQLEHRQLPTRAVETIVSLAQNELSNEAKRNSCLRAISYSAAKALAQPVVTAQLKTASNDIEFLLIVITRYPELMLNNEFAVPVLDQLAYRTDQNGFNRIITNLVMQPGLTGLVMQVLSSTALTEKLGNTIAAMIQQMRGNRAQH